MALVGDTLWVADIDVVRGFDRRTGAPMQTVDLGSLGAKFLNDVAAAPDGVLYVTDSGLELEAGGTLRHVGPDRVFRIDRDGKASVALEGKALSGPNGIAWDAQARRFVIVTMKGKDLLTWAPGDKAARPLASGVGAWDGVAAIGGGRWLVSSHHDQGLYVLRDGALEQLLRRPPRPADVGFDERRGRLLVPSLDGDWVEVWQLPDAAAAARTAERR
jgi:sugar lactone lactonase YvrE